TLINDERLLDAIKDLINHHQAKAIVVGWPRNLSGSVTAQTKTSEEFTAKLRQQINIPVYLQDEALTSDAAAEQLSTRTKQSDRKTQLHQYAAKMILEDFLASDQNV